MPTLNVTINGKTYRMACDEGQEGHLIELAAKFNGYVDNLKGSFGDIGDQRLTVMAAITVVDELNELKQKHARLESEIRSLHENSDGDQQARASLEADIVEKLGGVAEKLENLGQRLTG